GLQEVADLLAQRLGFRGGRRRRECKRGHGRSFNEGLPAGSARGPGGQRPTIGRATRRLVLLEGIELSTSPLPRECSTTELQQLRDRTWRFPSVSRRGMQAALPEPRWNTVP